MSDTTDHQDAPAVDTSSSGPAHDLDHAIAPWVQAAMSRAGAAGIDPRRVALALGIPWHAVDALPTPADHNDGGLR